MNGVANLALERESRVGNIAFIDLKAQQKRIREKVEARLIAVLDHGRYIAGPEIDELEEMLAQKTGAKKAIACASGTDALIIPLMALGVGPGDAVFIPAFTYNATANAVLIAGATPVFVDIDRETLNISTDHLQARMEEIAKQGKLTPRAVMPVDLFGTPADYPAIKAIADKYGAMIIADGAQSFGGKQNGKWVGALAPVTGISFFPGKALGAYGDAGAILLEDETMMEPCESIRWHGTDAKKQKSIRVGMNGRLDTFQAAVLLEKLAIFYDELEARKRIAHIYNTRLSKIAAPQEMIANTESGYGYYTVTTEKRDSIREAMNQTGVPTAIYYQTPLHQMEAFAAYAPAEGLPNCEWAADRVMSLPMHPYLAPQQAEFICDVFEAAMLQEA